jgi:hypothetical protein
MFLCSDIFTRRCSSIRDCQWPENGDEAFEFGRHVLVHGLRPGVHPHVVAVEDVGRDHVHGHGAPVPVRAVANQADVLLVLRVDGLSIGLDEEALTCSGRWCGRRQGARPSPRC